MIDRACKDKEHAVFDANFRLEIFMTRVEDGRDRGGEGKEGKGGDREGKKGEGGEGRGAEGKEGESAGAEKSWRGGWEAKGAADGGEKTHSEAVKEMSVKELKKMIDDAGLSHADCVEKSELRERGVEALVKLYEIYAPREIHTGGSGGEGGAADSKEGVAAGGKSGN
jgi:hypothetical protein